ncbi:MAG: tetratricopeptide repeat protein, partial [Myxococcota bacterium]
FILWDAVAQLQGGFCVRTHDMLAAAHKALLIPPTVADAQRSTWIQAFEALHADQDPGQDLLDFQLAAQALERLDRPRDAARFWRRCLGIEPRRPDIHVYMARACIEAHLSAPAMDSLVEGTKTIAMSEQEWLDDVDFDYELGRTYVLEGDLDQAIAHYRRSLDREPKPSTWLRVAWLQLARGRFAPAFAAARSAQALKPDHAEAAEVLAEIKEAWWKQTTASLEAAHHPQAEAAVFKEPLPLDDEAEEA